METSRRLAAIMFTDIVGYTALMGDDEETALRVLSKNRTIHKSIIERYQGEWLKEMGDGTLASFHTSTDAVRCAAAIQSEAQKNSISLRIGIHVGEMVFEDRDVFGDGVNISSRIQEITPPGGIWVSESVHKNVLNKKGIATSFVKEAQLKNVSEPVRIYEAKVESVEAAPIPDKPGASGKTHHRKVLPVIAGLLALLALSYFGGSYFTSSPKSEEQILEKSIAVLPFDNESADQENEYFVKGMMEDIRNNLAKISDLRVISKTSTEKYRMTTLTSREIGRELSINTLLEGTVQKLGNQVKIHAQLISTENDDHLWEDTYTRDITDIKEIFKVQSEIAQAIAAELRAVIKPEELAMISSIPTENIEVFDLYNRGRNYYYSYNLSNFDVRDLNNAQILYRKALQLDSTFAPAYVGLGLINLSRAGFSIERSLNELQYIDSIRYFASKALSLDSRLPEAYFLAGQYLFSTGEIDKALANQRKAVSLNPNMAQAFRALGELYRFKHDVVLAIININKAMALEKHGQLTPLLLSDLGNIYIDIGANEEAEKYFRESVRIQPDFLMGYHGLWWLSCIQGKFEEAKGFAEASCKLNEYRCIRLLFGAHAYLKDFKIALNYYEEYRDASREMGIINSTGGTGIYLYRKLGQLQKSQSMLQKYIISWNSIDDDRKSFWLAEAYAAIDDVENAMINLKKHDFRNDNGLLSFLVSSPIFESLWDSIEFQDLVKRHSAERTKVREEIMALKSAGKL